MISLPRANATIVQAHFDTVQPVLSKRIAKVIRNGIIVTITEPVIIAGKSKTRAVSRRIHFDPVKHEGIIDFLTDNDCLFYLITAQPEDISVIISCFLLAAPDISDSTSVINILLKNIFLEHAYEQLDKYQFIKNIDIDTCVYCNRNYIYYSDTDEIIKPQIDHFYPQSRYPFMGVSFFNLIPACQTCNGPNVKGNKCPNEENMVLPYLLTNDVTVFDYDITGVDLISSLKDVDKIAFTVGHPSIAGNMTAFKLDDFYQKHKDHVCELILKSKLEYSEQYCDYLNNYNGLNFTDSDIDRMLIGNYTQLDELHKRPLSKLYRDIALRLELINE